MQKRFDVKPKYGRVLMFQHRFLLHSGDDVVRGTKYTMRTDIMFAKEAAEEADFKHFHDEEKAASGGVGGMSSRVAGSVGDWESI
jgi:hypothetical protein